MDKIRWILQPCWTVDVTEMDKRVAIIGKDRVGASVEDYGGSCRQTASTTRTSLWSSNKSETCGLQYFHCPHSKMVTMPTIHLVNLWSSIPQDDIKSGEAASAAAMRRVTGARSDETRSEFGAEAEQQPTHWDEEGMPRRRDRTQLEVDKEVPTLDNQGTILRIHVKPWTRATAGHASDVQRRWSATFDSKVGVREVSLSGLRDTKNNRHAKASNDARGVFRSTSLWASVRNRCRACRVKKGSAGCRWYAGVSCWQPSSRPQ